LGATFAHILRAFAQIVRDFVKVFRDFAQNSMDFARILNVLPGFLPNQNFFSLPLHPSSYTSGILYEKHPKKPVVIYRDWQMLLLDVLFVTLIMQRLVYPT